MWKLVMGLICSWVLVLLIGKKTIMALRRLHFGQTIYDLGPQAHKGKQGTPIMGGLMMACAVLIMSLCFHPTPFSGVWDFTLALLAMSLLSMAIGFADDYTKAVRKQHEGLKPKQKLFLQIPLSALFAFYCYKNPCIGSRVLLPFSGTEWELGIFYIPLMTLLGIFIVNSCNLQDGVDGLLSTVTAVSMPGWAALGILVFMLRPGEAAGENHLNLASFALCLSGAAMGFLRFNRHPAKVFMGDTGSMFIGGAVAALAMLTRQPFLLLFLAIGPIASSVSVIIQRIYFKLTHGKRIFRMSPIHHHFELSGYSETQIVSMYACVTLVFTLAAVLIQIRIG